MYFDAIRYEYRSSTSGWIDVSEYVIGTDKVQMGINGWGPLDRVAGTGSFTFSLRNVNNMLTPGHPNCLNGFDVGIEVRLMIKLNVEEYIRFYGRVPEGGITLDISSWHALTTVTAVDYMEQLAIHELELPEFAENKRIDEIVPLIIANMPISPIGTEYNTGQDIFATVFDTTMVHTRALQEISKVVISEMGYVYTKLNRIANDMYLYLIGAGVELANGIYEYTPSMPPYYRKSLYGLSSEWAEAIIIEDQHGSGLWLINLVSTRGDQATLYYSLETVAVAPSPIDVTEWISVESAYDPPPNEIIYALMEREVLVVEGRRTRFGKELSAGNAVFEDCFQDINLSYGNNYYNHIKTTAYPRRVDSAATTVLFTLEKPIAVAAGETETIKGSFRDPDQEAVSVAGIAMVTPVASTDYLFNAAEDGSGTDLTANLIVTATYGVNGVKYELVNTGAVLGYVIHLQARGKGVYTYHPVEYEEKYDAGIALEGKRTLNLNLSYQNNALVAKDFAGAFLDLFASKRLSVESVTMIANKSEYLMEAFLTRQVGDKIEIIISSANIDGYYFIHSINWTITPSGIITFTYGLSSASLAPSESYWEIGEVGYSEIGETTVMGF